MTTTRLKDTVEKHLAGTISSSVIFLMGRTHGECSLYAYKFQGIERLPEPQLCHHKQTTLEEQNDLITFV